MTPRQDIIISLLKFINNYPEDSYDTFIASYSNNPSIQGQIFELIIIFLITLKCFENIKYDYLLDGKIENGYSSLTKINNFKEWLNKSLGFNGGKLNDFIVQNNNQLIVFSIQYVCNNNTSKSAYDCDLEKLFSEGEKKYKKYNYKISLIINTSLKNTKNKYRFTNEIVNQMEKNNLLLTSNDVKKAWKEFCKDYNSKNFDFIIQKINNDYLKLKKEKLRPFLHQKMASNQLENWFRQNDKIAILSHIMRSGKSITILLLCELLLRKNMCQKILIMTSVVNTINSFIQEIEKYIEFKFIKYKKQDEYITLEDNFKGIIFCSTQFLKMDKTKEKYKKLLNLNFDLLIVDESHFGNSNVKTFSLLYEPNEIDDKIIYNFQKKMKKTLFSSGTPQKTNIFYKISSKNIFKWSYIDESYIKTILKSPFNEETYKYMENRHGDSFTHYFEDEIINKNYDNKPIPVFLTMKWYETLNIMINQYNIKYKTNLGFDILSFLALEKEYNNKNESIYKTQFQICSTTDGEDLLKAFLNIIISSDKNQPSLIKQIEINQTKHKSRKSTIKNPLMFIIYLPTHTNHSNIYELQVALYNFIKEHNLWNDYYISYSCSKGNSLNQPSLEYNDFLRQIMNETKASNKRGCILFLGDQGNLGITYPYCDVTICLDNSHNIDSLEQKKARSLTQASGKTIGINVDLNIHRFYNTLYYYCIDYRKETKSTKTNAEILEYFYKYNIFLFDILDHNFNYNQKDLKIDFEEFSKNMISNIEHDNLLEMIECNDDLKDIIKHLLIYQVVFKKDTSNDDEEIPKAGIVKIKGNSKQRKEKQEKEEDLQFEINYTLEFCKRFIPFLCYLCKSLKISDIFEILNKKKYIMIFLNQKYFKSEINNDSYNKLIEIMKSIIQHNMEIIYYLLSYNNKMI